MFKLKIVIFTIAQISILFLIDGNCACSDRNDRAASQEDLRNLIRRRSFDHKPVMNIFQIRLSRKWL